MTERIIFKFQNYIVTISRKQENIVFQIRDYNHEAIGGDFDNISDLLDAVDKLEKMTNQQIETLN